MTDFVTRPPAVAGTFYPANPRDLRDILGEFFAAVAAHDRPAAGPPPGATVRAVIAPHAGYVYSGPIAAYSFSALQARPAAGTAAAPVRVFLMGPAHFVGVPVVALGSYGSFETPLGSVPVDTDTVKAMLGEKPALYMQANVAHNPEHSLEVQLPFLQQRLPDFRIVPMLFGSVDVEAVARDLDARLAPGDLIVVSSDLSHYHAYESARARDARFLDAVLQGDLAAAERGEACGKMPILALMLVAASRGWQPVLRDARNSGDTSGDRRRVVGYASVVYYERATD